MTSDDDIKKHIARFLRGIPYVDEDDVLQETLERAHKFYDPSRGDRLAFCKKVARHLAIDHVRRFIKQRKAIDDSGGRSSAGGPPPLQIIERLLRITLSAALPSHEVIVFLFVTVLRWKPKEVRSGLSGETLREAGLLLTEEYASRSTLPDAVIRAAFAPLHKILAPTGGLGEKEVRQFFTGSDEASQQAQISRWAAHIKTAILSRAVFELPDILRFICESLHPHQVIAYGCIVLLGRTPRLVVLSFSRRPLSELAESIEAKCVTEAPHLSEAVLQAVAPLREKLKKKASEVLMGDDGLGRYGLLVRRDPVLGETELCDYYRQRKPAPALKPKDEAWVEACVMDLTGWRDDTSQRISEWIHG